MILARHKKSNFRLFAATIVVIDRAGAARFFSLQTDQNGENIPNEHKQYQMAIKYAIRP
jgi:hypothetical protein